MGKQIKFFNLISEKCQFIKDRTGNFVWHITVITIKTIPEVSWLVMSLNLSDD